MNEQRYQAMVRRGIEAADRLKAQLLECEASCPQADDRRHLVLSRRLHEVVAAVRQVARIAKKVAAIRTAARGRVKAARNQPPAEDRWTCTEEEFPP